jgi:hypothetical protein
VATVLVWYPKPKAVGHAALALESGTYISWWPEGEKSGVQSANSVSSSISLDKRLEGGKGNPPKIPDYASAPIHGLDEAAIENWWLKVAKRAKVEGHAVRQQPNRISGGKYNLFAKNCSDVVLEALLLGGMHKAFPITMAMTNNIVATPLYIRDLAEAMSGQTGNKIQAVLTNSSPAATTLIRGIQYFL